MRGTCPQLAKVAGSANDPLTKVVQPNPIDNHASKQGVVFAGQPASKGQATTCRWQLGIVFREADKFVFWASDRKCGGSNRLFGLLVIAAVKEFGGWNVVAWFH